MANDFENPAAGKLTPADLLKLGKERTDAMLTLQKDLLDAYEQAIPGSRASETGRGYRQNREKHRGLAAEWMQHERGRSGPEASWSEVMTSTNRGDPPVEDERVPRDWAKLICKLRWIGLEDEARRLQLAARTLTPEERDSVSAGPFSTD